MDELAYIGENVENVLSDIDRLKKKDVTCVFAVKYATDEEFLRLIEAPRVTAVGENRVQQLLHHYELAGTDNRLDWHFIGTLQKNKVKYIVGKVSLIHSVDSVELAKEIDRQSKKIGKISEILVEINSCAEESKSGISWEELPAFLEAVSELSNVRVKGLMTMGRKCETKEEYLNIFSSVRQKGLAIWEKISYNNIDKKCLFSMGMSQSYGEAVVCGADFVRVGRKTFERTTEGTL